MFLIFNATGLDRSHRRPYFRRQAGTGGHWFVEARWLGLQLCAFSRRAGNAAIARMNAATIPDAPAATSLPTGPFGVVR